MLKIRLKRQGRKRLPFYRLVIMENLSNLWPSLVPTGIIDGDAKIIYDAVAEINLI